MNNEQLYRHIINNLTDGVYFVDTERTITFWNAAAETITGYTADEIVGKRCQDNILNHIDEEGRPLCQVGCPLFATLIDGNQRKHRVFLRHKDGHRIPILVNIFPVVDNGEIKGAIEIFTRDSPVRYDDDLIERLSSIAMKDALTNLPNRRYLESYLDYKLTEFKRYHAPFALLFADIDNFSEVNNTHGHEVGDLVLQNVAKSARSHMRRDDFFGRWGGEEFVGVYSIKQPFEATILAEKLRALVAGTEALAHDGTRISVTMSIGVTTPQDNDTLETLIERADQLMYQSKERGKNCVSAV